MKNNRLITYLILNIIVSALTTLSVLIIWDWTHQLQPISFSLLHTATPTLPTSDATVPPLADVILQIDNVYSIGQSQEEVVVIKRIGEGELWLTGWKLVDQQKHEYIFPRLSLNKGEINVYTRAGIDTAKDLHWGQPQAIWQTGEKVRILDPLGNLRAEYLIP